MNTDILTNKVPNVLLVGSPRSGTTWLGKMFDSSEFVLYRHEPDSVEFCPNLPFNPTKIEAESLSELVRTYLEKLVTTNTTKAAGSLPGFPKAYRGKFANRLHKSLVVEAKLRDRILSRSPFNIRARVADLIDKNKLIEISIVIKSVDSLTRTYAFSCAAPDLKIVHIIRHPCAFVASQLRGAQLNVMNVDAFITAQAAMEGAKEKGLTIEVLERFTLEEKLASLWMLQNEKVMCEMHDRENYMMIKYEDLCMDSMNVLKKVYEFSEIPFTEQVESFIKRSHATESRSESYFSVMKDPISSAYKWQEELNLTQIENITSVTRDSAPGKLFF